MSLKDRAAEVMKVNDMCDATALSHKFGTNIYICNKSDYREYDRSISVNTFMGKKEFLLMKDGRMSIGDADVNSIVFGKDYKNVSKVYKEDKYEWSYEDKGYKSYGMCNDELNFWKKY